MRPLVGVLVLLSGLLLTACESSKALVKIPDSLKDCGVEPQVTGQEDDVDVANLILNFRDWGAGCQTNLRAVVNLVEPVKGT